MLDLSKWEFYVLSPERINGELGRQKRVALGRVRVMTEPVRHVQLKERVEKC